MSRTITKFIGILLFGMLLSLITLEVGLRLLDSLTPKINDYLLPDEFIGHKLKPNIDIIAYNAEDTKYEVKTVTLGFDGIGFRDDGIDKEPFAIALGDSYTFGTGLELDKVWTEILEEKLGKDVVNMGVDSYSAVEEKKVLEKFGLKLNPKIIFTAFFVNDFDGAYLAISEETDNLDFIETLKRSSKLYKTVHESIGKLLQKGKSLDYRNGSLDIVLMPTFWENILNPASSRSLQLGENITKGKFLEMSSIANENNVELIVLMLPSREQTYWHLLRNLTKTPINYDLDYPMKTLGEFCKNYKLKCLDLTPKLREHAMNGEQVFFKIDGHLNEKGNQIVADEVYKYLDRNKLI